MTWLGSDDLDLTGQGRLGLSGFVAVDDLIERDEVAVHSGVGLGQLGSDQGAFGEAFDSRWVPCAYEV